MITSTLNEALVYAASSFTLIGFFTMLFFALYYKRKNEELDKQAQQNPELKVELKLPNPFQIIFGTLAFGFVSIFVAVILFNNKILLVVVPAILGFVCFYFFVRIGFSNKLIKQNKKL